MRSKRFVTGAVLAAALLTGGLLVGRLVHHTGHTAAHSQGALYYCPMHPTYTSDRPGNCPICSMKLVEHEPAVSPHAAMGSHAENSAKEICLLHNCPRAHEGQPCPMLVVGTAGEEVTCPVCGTHVVAAQESPGGSVSGYASILVTHEKQQLIGVKTAPAQRQAMTKTIRSIGRVEVDQTRVVHAHPKVEGWVAEIYAKYEGDAVKRGQPLFSLYSPDFVSTQQEYLAALKMVREIPADAAPDVRIRTQEILAAADKRLLWWDISEAQIRELQERGTPSKNMVLNSPIDGVILKKHVWPGEYMERGGDYYHIADLSTIWVDIQLYEADLPWVSVGQEATVTLNSDAAQQFHGKLIFVSPLLNPDTRTATARLEFANPNNVLKPGLFVEATIAVDLGKRLVVPSEAILDTGVRQILFVDKGQGLFDPREVTVGVKADGAVEIKQGVAEGEQVVVGGNFLIDSESRLKGALGMTGGEHHHGQ